MPPHQRLPSVVHVRMGPRVQIAFEQDCVAPVRLQSGGPHGDRVVLLQGSSAPLPATFVHRACETPFQGRQCGAMLPTSVPLALRSRFRKKSILSPASRRENSARRRPNHWRSVARCPSLARIRVDEGQEGHLLASGLQLPRHLEGNHSSHRVAAEEVRAGRLHLANLPHVVRGHVFDRVRGSCLPSTPTAWMA